MPGPRVGARVGARVAAQVGFQAARTSAAALIMTSANTP